MERNLYVTSIEVQELFGRYNYSIECNLNNDFPGQPLLILYGDNGSGKTTILKLLYHLLSPETGAGHRAHLARTPFREFTVHLSNGYVVTAIREKDDPLIGSFHLLLKSPASNTVLTAYCAAREDGSFKVVASKQYLSIIEEFNRFDIDIYLLGEDRQVEGGSIESIDSEDLRKFRHDNFLIQRKHNAMRLGHNVDIALERATDWIQREVLSRSAMGEKEVYLSYPALVRSALREKKELHDQAELLDFIILLENCQERSGLMAKYGLTSIFSVQQFIDILIENNDSRTISLALKLLRPFLDSVTTRLDALQSTYELIDAFVNSINQFFTDKVVSFTIETGFLIESSNGETLVPALLSSGERHLLILLCNALPARGKNSVYIIDEPELSLNFKWQRQLIDTMLKITRGSSVQFIIATHSFELIGDYRLHTIKLENQESEE